MMKAMMMRMIHDDQLCTNARGKNRRKIAQDERSLSEGGKKRRGPQKEEGLKEKKKKTERSR